MSIVGDLSKLRDEPIMSRQNERIFKRIIGIKRTSEFATLNLSEEKLDELYESLERQENFIERSEEITRGLEDATAITITEDDIDFI